ncbi:MAG TPA: histidine triad nucleotide-binding protein [Firmicutes bacterium]|nr:histidine triad nucleotide-binding protein [Bacillota bacterium]
MSDCLFCKIAAGQISSDIVYSDEQVVAFKDINPQAPVHLLIIPRKHIPNVNSIEEDDRTLIGHIHHIAAKLAKEQGFADDGYRIVVNCGEQGGQTVMHLHFHLLGGRSLGWPPG